MGKTKKQDMLFNFRSNERVQDALVKLADFYGLTCSSYLRMMILREVKLIT